MTNEARDYALVAGGSAATFSCHSIKTPEVKDLPKFKGCLGCNNDLVTTGLQVRNSFHHLQAVCKARQMPDRFIVEKFPSILENDAFDHYVSLCDTLDEAFSWSLDQWAQRFHNNYLTPEFHHERQRQHANWKFPRSENDAFQWAGHFYRLYALLQKPTLLLEASSKQSALTYQST
jgi:hypothetical protein